MFEAHLQVSIFYTLLSVFVLSCSILMVTKRESVYRYSLPLMIMLAFFAILLIGWREWWVHEVFFDSYRYGSFYVNALFDAKDMGFYVLQDQCKRAGLSVDMFFLICASLYVIPYALASQKISHRYGFIVLLAIMSTMGFYSYGVNGIRNGLAISFLLLAFSRNKIVPFILFSIIAVSFHKSVALTLLSFIVAQKICNNIKWGIMLWLLTIPFSFVAESIIKNAVLGIDFFNERVEGYFTTEADADQFSHVGFRYDFVLYSAIPVLIGWYFQVRKKFTDKFYRILYCTYLYANAFWIIINSVPYSNRFAQLSWFLMPVLIIYPFIYYDSIRFRFPKIAMVLIAQLCFVLIMKK